jgi:hypothetical protein
MPPGGWVLLTHPLRVGQIQDRIHQDNGDRGGNRQLPLTCCERDQESRPHSKVATTRIFTAPWLIIAKRDSFQRTFGRGQISS